jgi:hypothetical protein
MTGFRRLTGFRRRRPFVRPPTPLKHTISGPLCVCAQGHTRAQNVMATIAILAFLVGTIAVAFIYNFML